MFLLSFLLEHSALDKMLNEDDDRRRRDESDDNSIYTYTHKNYNTKKLLDEVEHGV